MHDPSEDVRRRHAILLIVVGLGLLSVGTVSWVRGGSPAAMASMIPGLAGVLGGLLLLARRGLILRPTARFLSIQPDVLLKLSVVALAAASAVYLGWVAVVQYRQGRADAGLTVVMAALSIYVTIRAFTNLRR